MTDCVVWVCLSLFVYSWVIYPLGVFYYSRGRQGSACDPEEWPGVSIVVPVRNGAQTIIEKLENLVQIDYPEDRNEIIIVSDGSTDTTVEKIREFVNNKVTLLVLQDNKGKSYAQNLGVEKARFPFVLFTDLEARFSPATVKRLVRPLSNVEFGCVGASVVFSTGSNTDIGLYSKFEHTLLRSESRLGILISVWGSAYIARKECLQPLESDTGDDFVIPMDLALKGSRTIIAEDAKVSDEWVSPELGADLRRRIRITSRSALALWRRRKLLNPFAYKGIAFTLISHKVLRWLAPFFLIVIFMGSMISSSRSYTMQLLLAAQIVCYLLAIVGLFLRNRKHQFNPFDSIGSFILAQFGIAIGIGQFILGKRIRGYENV